MPIHRSVYPLSINDPTFHPSIHSKIHPQYCMSLFPAEPLPCEHNDIIYANGVTFMDDCNECTCRSGLVACTEMACRKSSKHIAALCHIADF